MSNPNPSHLQEAVGDVTLSRYPLWRRGKVRDIFDADDRLIIVATDRVSAFDVVLPNLIPGKGRILTEISRFWFGETRHICRNHVIAFDVAALEVSEDEAKLLQGRVMQVHKADRIDIECVVRARLGGSGWDEYQKRGTLANEPVPAGLSKGDELPDLRFTPATKNDSGHDINISRRELASEIGTELADTLEQLSLDIFRHASDVARSAGFVLADSKFEFGFIDDEIAIIDEVLTPDSSRYWDARSLAPGASPPGYDKQVIRDWLLSTDWNREPPAPELPLEIIQTATQRYELVRERLTSVRSRAGSTGEERP